MLKQENITQSPVQTINEQTRLENFFKLLSTQDTAKLIRQTVFTLSEFHSLPDAPSSITYSDRVNSFCFYLNQLAESIEPYYTKD